MKGESLHIFGRRTCEVTRVEIRNEVDGLIGFFDIVLNRRDLGDRVAYRQLSVRLIEAEITVPRRRNRPCLRKGLLPSKS